MKQASPMLFKIGQTIAGNALKNSKQEIGTILNASKSMGKLAVKGGAIAGAISGVSTGVNKVKTYAQQDSTSSFSLAECNTQETALHLQTDITRKMDNFKSTTENTITEVVKKTKRYAEEYDEQAVDKSIARVPAASGLIAGISKITGSKKIVATTAATIDLLFASGPVAVAGIAQTGVENLTEAAVFSTGKLVIDTYRKQQIKMEQAYNLSKIKEALNPNFVTTQQTMKTPPTTPAVKRSTSNNKSVSI
jgi:hypothetical protein